jgi:hypothetical protein
MSGVKVEEAQSRVSQLCESESEKEISIKGHYIALLRKNCDQFLDLVHHRAFQKTTEYNVLETGSVLILR